MHLYRITTFNMIRRCYQLSSSRPIADAIQLIIMRKRSPAPGVRVSISEYIHFKRVFALTLRTRVDGFMVSRVSRPHKHKGNTTEQRPALNDQHRPFRAAERVLDQRTISAFVNNIIRESVRDGGHFMLACVERV